MCLSIVFNVALAPDNALYAFGEVVLMYLVAIVADGVDLAELLWAVGFGDDGVVYTAVGAQEEAISSYGSFHFRIENI